MNYERKIHNYFHERLTDSVCEGISFMTLVFKIKTLGFNTHEGFETIIYLIDRKPGITVQIRSNHFFH